MAEEKKAGSAQEADGATGRGGKMKLIIILVLVMVLAGSGAGAYFFKEKIPFVNKYFAKPEAEGEEGAKEGQAKKKEHIGPILPLDPFVFNLAGSQTKFAKITVAVETKDTKVMEEAKKIIPVIRDGVLAVLSVKSPETLLDVPSRDKLKKDIQENLKGIFKAEGAVQAVYITDVVIQ